MARDNWDSHWDHFFEASQVNPAGAYRLRLIFRWLQRHVESGSRFLDIGSGTGDLVSEFSRRFPHAPVRGVELSATGIGIAEKRAPQAQFLQCDVLEVTRPPDGWAEWADVAVCSEVLEHVDEAAVFLSNARAFLSPDCRILVTVPGGPRSAFDRYIGHRRHYSRRDLIELLEDAGLTLERCDARGFPFFNAYRLMVIARGRRLVSDAESGRIMSSAASRVAGSVFDTLLRLNPPMKRWGWQLVAEARITC